MQKILDNLKKWYHDLPDKKKYLELISTALTVPMLLTVIIINLNNINGQKNSNISNITPTQIITITQTPTQPENNKLSPTTNLLPTVTISPTSTPSPTPTPTPNSTSCINKIGPIEIISPQEGEIISGDSACINISIDSKYCSLVWSYKLDDEDWSNFNNNNICLYNLSDGKKQLQIKFKNISTGETITLERNFIYQKSSITPTITITPVSATPTSTK